jgi:hypothetical protein
MTKIYCLKCKAFTETDNEDRDISKNGRYRLSGWCTECGKVKCEFTDENYNFKTHKKLKKSAEEKSLNKIKSKERAMNRRAKKLGHAILDSEKKTQRKVRRILNEV